MIGLDVLCFIQVICLAPMSIDETLVQFHEDLVLYADLCLVESMPQRTACAI